MSMSTRKPQVCFPGVKETLQGALNTAGKQVEALSDRVQELLVIQEANDELANDELVGGMKELDEGWLVMKHSQRLALDAPETLQGQKALACWKVTVQTCRTRAENVLVALNGVVATTREPAASNHLDEIKDLAALASVYNTAFAQHAAAQQAATVATELLDSMKRIAWLVNDLISVIPEKEGGEAAAISVPQGM